MKKLLAVLIAGVFATVAFAEASAPVEAAHKASASHAKKHHKASAAHAKKHHKAKKEASAA